MTYHFPPALEKLVREQMALGEYRSEDDLLLHALTSLDEHRHMVAYDEPEVLAGIRQGLDEMKLGLGRAFEEVDAELRARFGIKTAERS